MKRTNSGRGKKRNPTGGDDSLTVSPLPIQLNLQESQQTDVKNTSLLYWLFVAPVKAIVRAFKRFFSSIGAFVSSFFSKSKKGSASSNHALDAHFIDSHPTVDDEWIKPAGQGHIYDLTGARSPASRVAPAMYLLNEPQTAILGAGVQKDALRGHYFISESGEAIQAPSQAFFGTRAALASTYNSGALELFLTEKGFQHHEPTSDISELKVKAMIKRGDASAVEEISGMAIKSYVVEPFQLLEDGTVACKYKTNINALRHIQTGTEYVKYKGERGLRLLPEGADRVDLFKQGLIEPIMHVDAKMIVMDHTPDTIKSLKDPDDYMAHSRHLQLHIPTCSIVCPTDIQVTGLRFGSVQAGSSISEAPLSSLELSSFIRFPRSVSAHADEQLSAIYKPGTRFKEGGLTSDLDLVFDQPAIDQPAAQFNADGYAATFEVGYQKIGSRASSLINHLKIDMTSEHPQPNPLIVNEKYGLANLLLERQDVRFRYPSNFNFHELVRPISNGEQYKKILGALSHSVPENCTFIRSYDLFLKPGQESDYTVGALHRFSRGEDYVYLADPVVIEKDGQMPWVDRLNLILKSGRLDFLAQVGGGVTELVLPVVQSDKSITLLKLSIIKDEDDKYTLQTLGQVKDLHIDTLADAVNIQMNAAGAAQDDASAKALSKVQMQVDSDAIGIPMLSFEESIQRTLALDGKIAHCRENLAAIQQATKALKPPANRPKLK